MEFTFLHMVPLVNRALQEYTASPRPNLPRSPPPPFMRRLRKPRVTDLPPNHPALRVWPALRNSLNAQHWVGIDGLQSELLLVDGRPTIRIHINAQTEATVELVKEHVRNAAKRYDVDVDFSCGIDSMTVGWREWVQRLFVKRKA